MCGPVGQFAPRRNAIVALTLPAASPLSIAICTGSPADTFCVRLLSIAQQRHAPATATGPPSRQAAPRQTPLPRQHHATRDDGEHAERDAAVHVLTKDEPREQGGE